MSEDEVAPLRAGVPGDDELEVPGPTPAFEQLLTFLKDARRFDFTGYKRSSLMRRVRRRMATIGIDAYEEYLDHLQANPEEFAPLLDTVLINVTAFFRDADVWEHLGGTVVPDLLRRRPTGPLRVWCAGCASGEEAYSLAMLLAEEMGVDRFRERVKLYATDVDEEALAEARLAVYSERRLEDVDAALVERWFEPVPNSPERRAVRKDLRRSVIFGRNDLVQDAPISRIDLLLCRNTLMYFNLDQQQAILQRLHFALAPQGLLLLGKAEMILARDPQFESIDLRRRLFRRDGSEAPRVSGAIAPRRPAPAPQPREDPLAAASVLHSPVAVFVLADGHLTLVNERAQHLLGLTSRDVGRPFQDLEISYRPVDLRSAVDQALQQRLPVWLRDVAWERSGQAGLVIEIQVTPLAVVHLGWAVAVYITDVTRYDTVRRELELANRQVETAYEELQSANEELETTNEELQSTVEELETTNEELQSTNEELETMNEELQSMNEELQSSNTTLRVQTAEIEELNHLLGAILRSLRGGVIVLDSDLRVLSWNRQSEELWGLRDDEAVGRHFYSLDIGLPLDATRPLVRRLLSAGTVEEGRGAEGSEVGESVELDAHNRRGRPIRVRVTGSPLLTPRGSVSGAVLVTEIVATTGWAAPEEAPDVPDDQN